MGAKVFANGLEVSGAASGHIVAAAMPDVCLSPPAPPAGPVPVPYPDTSKSKDLKEGSKEVTIGGKPVTLGSKSHYKSAPLGDEASTKSFGANPVVGGNAGKTFCQAHSMNVKVEDEPVTRTGDITTSNHAAAQPGGCSVPMPQVAGGAPSGPGGVERDPNICECCGGAVHSEAQRSGKSMTAREWYNPPHTPSVPPTKRDKQIAAVIADAQAGIELSREAGCGNMHDDDSTDPCAKHYDMTETVKKSRQDYMDMMSPSTSLEFLQGEYGPTMGTRVFNTGARMRAAGASSIAHKTPLAAGGCPVGDNNLSPVHGSDCAYLENQLGILQGEIKRIRNAKVR